MSSIEPNVETKPTPKALTRKGKAAKEAELRLKQAQRASILLKQASDPTRLQIILMLSEGERHVGSLGDELNQSQPAISHHLALLRHGGIIAPRRQGKNNFYALTDLGEELAGVVKDIMH
jgi:ArsR family transcriptional regulator, zinc-responsive transcriptional repressor